MSVTVRWGKEEWEVALDALETADSLGERLENFSSVPRDRQKLLGLPGGRLTSLGQLKAGMKLTLLGTPAAQQLKPLSWSERVRLRFVEDMTEEEKQQLLKQRRLEAGGDDLQQAGVRITAGLTNLGNTCYANSVVQAMGCLDKFVDVVGGSGGGSGADGALTRRLGELMREMNGGTSDVAVTPLSFLVALRTRFPDFARMEAHGGNFQQQDAEECWRGILEAVGGSVGQEKVDEIFGFDLRVPGRATPERQRILLCHLGSQTAVVNHVQEGLRLSLGGNSGTSEMLNLPPYLTVQFARFSWKGRSETAGTEATRTKVTRKCTFPKILDMHEFLTGDLKDQLKATRELKAQRELEPEAAAGTGKAAATGFFQLKAIVSHQGRSAEGGHYVAWVRATKKDAKKEIWVKFDDDTVSEVGDWSRLEQAGIQGGLADSQMAYFVVYEREEL